MRIFTVLTVLFSSSMLGGCYASHERPDTGNLVILPGSMDAMSVSHGDGIAIMSFLLVNQTSRDITLSGIQEHAHGVLADHVDEAVRNSRLTSGDGTALTGSYAFGHSFMGEHFFEETITVRAGESLEVALLVDVPNGASNRIEFDLGQYVVGLPTSTGRSLFTVIAFADSGELVPVDRVLGNESMERHVIIGDGA